MFRKIAKFFAREQPAPTQQSAAWIAQRRQAAYAVRRTA